MVLEFVEGRVVELVSQLRQSGLIELGMLGLAEHPLAGVPDQLALVDRHLRAAIIY